MKEGEITIVGIDVGGVGDIVGSVVVGIGVGIAVGVDVLRRTGGMPPPLDELRPPEAKTTTATTPTTRLPPSMRSHDKVRSETFWLPLVAPTSWRMAYCTVMKAPGSVAPSPHPSLEIFGLNFQQN